MIHCFVESTVCKWTAKSVTHRLLNLGCYVMIVLGMLLIPNSSQAFQKDDKVVAQNRGPSGEVIVRSNHWVSDPWDATVKGRVPNGTRGTIQDGPERGGIYIWYEVEWETYAGTLKGWSAETVNGCQVIGPAEEAEQRDVVTAALFGLGLHEVDRKTNHDYNGYGCGVSWKDNKGNDLYDGGHAGWDAQTKNRSLNQTFYSLTDGTIIVAGEDGSNTIAIFDGAKTTLYLHANTIDPSLKGKTEVEGGDPLGTQGMTGKATGPHLHIEVHDGRSIVSSSGTEDDKKETENPVPYLYDWVKFSLPSIGGGGGPVYTPEDVDQDGQIGIMDLILVWSNFGPVNQNNQVFDVNDDGTIDSLDLVAVAKRFGEIIGVGAPASRAIEDIITQKDVGTLSSLNINPEGVQQWIDVARAADNGSLTFKQGIAMLESLLTRMIPERTILLANYPNPFNPETWIPYQLSEPAEVTVTIYAADGRLIRTLALGHQPVGVYQSKNRAAYWDGKNELGEPVASGVYFYTLTAGEFTATRKMLIRK